ncbi:MAG: hypothetical protein K2R98_06205 [Gemmataceae bacterium]|nr:hypothetical protein [Gemmataceae bacterium]
MSQKVTLELPEDVAQRIRHVAAHSHRTFEDVVVESIERGAAEPPIESLPDADVLRLCDAEMTSVQQQELEQLQDGARAGRISPNERGQLDDLLRTYRRGLVRKAQALRVPVQRGLLQRAQERQDPRPRP